MPRFLKHSADVGRRHSLQLHGDDEATGPHLGATNTMRNLGPNLEISKLGARTKTADMIMDSSKMTKVYSKWLLPPYTFRDTERSGGL